MFRRVVAADPPSIRIRTDELRTVREAMRDFGSLLTELEEGEVEKLVLTQRNRMRAVVVSVERWSELEQAALAGTRPGRPVRMPVRLLRPLFLPTHPESAAKSRSVPAIGGARRLRVQHRRVAVGTELARIRLDP